MKKCLTSQAVTLKTPTSYLLTPIAKRHACSGLGEHGTPTTCGQGRKPGQPLWRTEVFVKN